MRHINLKKTQFFSRLSSKYKCDLFHISFFSFGKAVGGNGKKIRFFVPETLREWAVK